MNNSEKEGGTSLEIDMCDPPRHKYLNLPNLCNIILTG